MRAKTPPLAQKGRRICVVTTSRADYWLLRWLMQEIRSDGDLELQVAVTGMHLSPEFGCTCRAIEEDGFEVAARVEMLLSSDTGVGTAKSVGVGVLGFADAFERLAPDVVVLLGDRFELFSAAVPALMLTIPIAHLHGGETSQGALDEHVRHAITKLAAIHFPAAEEYRRRIIQMGEDPSRVFNLGAPGLDGLRRIDFPGRSELEQRLGFELGCTTALVTYHPVTLEKGSEPGHVRALLEAVRSSGVRAVFTGANADEEGRLINREIRGFCDSHPKRYRFFTNLGAELYLGCMKHCALMLGNSSSGLIEAPSFRLPVVNVGDRQRGRIRAGNVIDCPCTVPGIEQAIAKALSPEFRHGLRGLRNPYDACGDGNASRRIKDVLKTIDVSPRVMKKEFRDYLR